MTDEFDKEMSKSKVLFFTKKNSVFVNSILCSLRIVRDKTIDTANVDGKSICINPDTFLELDRECKISRLAHETWHVPLGHCIQIAKFKTQREREIYNIAADQFINLMLVDNGFKKISTWCYDTQYRNMSTMQIYEKLINDPEFEIPAGFKLDIKPSTDPDKDKEDLDQLVLVAAKQAAIYGEDAGKLPTELQIHIDRLLNPRLPLRRILMKYMTALIPGDYTYRKFNKKYIPQYYLPTCYSEALDHIAIAMDLSASVTDEEVHHYLSELDGIKQKFKPRKVTLATFTTRINKVFELGTRDRIQDLKLKGRGGTALEPVFTYFNEHKPKVLIVFSDLECDPIKNKPNYPVIWICTQNPNAKVNFGKLIHYEMP